MARVWVPKDRNVRHHIILRRRARQSRKHAQATRLRIWSAIWLVLTVVVVVVPLAILLGGAVIVYADAVEGLPTPVETTFLDSEGITRLIDSTGATTLFRVSDPLGDRREWTRLDTLPAGDRRDADGGKTRISWT
ncbi:MAG: hypothetical protein IPK52_20800 [Chloroflexi bacterium]|nr:hypothetical protein [Chloroflexota bacterium]